MNAHGSQEYLRNAVMTASPERLQLMLFDGAIRFATRGREAVVADDLEGAFNALDRAQRITLQLAAGMNREVNPDLVDQMAALYNFVYSRLVDGCVRRQIEPIDEALRVLRHLRETWILLMDKIAEHRASNSLEASAPRPSLSIEG
ncbi:MAG: flagellar export chaperone FliS [Phycisphaerales bacterium]|nr:flagellar export chaperone FliS [Phycisphaerales bacterium]